MKRQRESQILHHLLEDTKRQNRSVRIYSGLSQLILIIREYDHRLCRASSVERKSWTKQITNQNTQLYKQSTMLFFFFFGLLNASHFLHASAMYIEFFLKFAFPPFNFLIIILQQKNESNSYYCSIFILCILMRAVSIVKGGHSNTTMCRTCWALNGINLLFWMNAHYCCIYYIWLILYQLRFTRLRVPLYKMLCSCCLSLALFGFRLTMRLKWIEKK